jgi:ABC-type transport system involved in cytochrome c biogenesis permease component
VISRQGGLLLSLLTLPISCPTVVAMPMPLPVLSASSSSGTASEADEDCSTVRCRSAADSTRSLHQNRGVRHVNS